MRIPMVSLLICNRQDIECLFMTFFLHPSWVCMVDDLYWVCLDDDIYWVHQLQAFYVYTSYKD